MTASKHPARIVQNIKNTKDIELNNSIDELENLISDKTGPGASNTGNSVIPVLDEVVDPDSMEDYIEESRQFQQLPKSTQPGITRDRLDSLIGNMDERITGELDALVNILKDSIKDSLLAEIKSQLEHDLDNPPSENSDSDNQTGS
jgi:hypothetical protein